MIGLSELIIPGIILLLILIFGPKTFTNAYRKWKSVREEIKDIDKDFKETNADVKKEFDFK
jgi:Sec-independent protein translocase protein TatA